MTAADACPSDDTLVAMLEHALDAGAIAEVERHIDSCDHCRRVVAAAATQHGLAAGTMQPNSEEPASAELPPMAPVGSRYEVIRPLGRGGMGTVYLARDKSLAREVALKVHRAGSGNDRLHREALAMAKLAHPNVVTVFEVTTFEDRLCVAMEYVKGTTLRGWVRETPREWRATLATLLGAGEGLAAAHAAGLVHRDFKPENVLVGTDHRPRVGDFGLARELDRRSAPGIAAPADVPKSEAAPLTQAGTIVGTPGYMAPEQLSGETVDARADQFAFCVVAWEALYGARPFTGPNLTALLLAIEKQQLPAPKDSTVPERVRAALARGLALEPSGRHADMRALLAALGEAARPRTRRRLAIAAAGLVVAAAGATLGVHALSARHHEAGCIARGEDIRARVSDSALAPIRDTFVATKAPNARTAFEHTAAVLAKTGDALAVQTVETCRGRDEPQRMTDARTACLAERERELVGLIAVLARADAPSVQHAPNAAWALFDPRPCDDAHTLLATEATAHEPTSPADAATLARGHVLLAAGRYQEGIDVVKPLADAARGRNDSAMELAALGVLGELRMEIDPPETVQPVLDRQLALAEAQGKDADAVAALDELANLSGTVLKQHAAAHHSLDLARAKLERLGGGNDALRGSLLATEAQILIDEGKYPEAEQASRESIKALAQAYGSDHPKLGSAYGTLTEILLGENKAEAALEAGERTYQILAAAFGEDHPSVAGADMTVAQCLISLNRFDEARTRLLRADGNFARLFGAVHPTRAAIFGNLGSLEQAQEHWDAALAAYHQALSVIEQLSGPESADASGARRDIAKTLALAGRLDEARAEQLRAIAIVEKLGEDGASRVAEAKAELEQIDAALKAAPKSK